MALSSIARTLIYSDSATWNSGSYQPTLVTYSFATPANGAHPTSSGQAWSSFNAAQQASARLALDSWASVSGIRMVEVPDTPAGAGIDIRLQFDTMAAGTAGFAYYPRSGDVSISMNYAQDALNPGGYGYLVLMHEIGHAFGLKHPFEGSPTLPADEVNFNTTVMAYPKVGIDIPATLRAADVEAIQYLYGTQGAEDAFSVHWNWDAGFGGIRHDGDDSNQTITGTALRDIIIGYGGNDVLNGGGGNDLIYGGNGFNTVSGGTGTDTLATGRFRLETELQGLRAGAELNGGVLSRAMSGEVYTPGEHQVFNCIEILSFGDGRLVFDDNDPAAQVVRLYQAALGRQPDAAGREFWTSQLMEGAPLSRLANGFLSSPEFLARFGQPDDTGFVATAYRQALGREPDADGQAYWQSKLASGFSRADLLTGFSESPENRAITAPLVANGIWDGDDQVANIARLYKAVLGRTPELDGLRYWDAQADHGATEAQMANLFATSPEFNSRFPGASDVDFVSLVYLNTLGRAPDQDGQTFWLNHLSQGLTRGEMVAGVSHSSEFLTLTTSLTEGGVVFA